MDLLKGYDSSRDSSPGRPIVAAPEVDIQHLVVHRQNQQDQIREQMYRPARTQNHLTGHIAEYSMNHFIFEEQCNNFKSLGYAQDPGTHSDHMVFNAHVHASLNDQSKKGQPVQLGLDTISRSSLQGKHKDERMKKQEIKASRKTDWNPASSDFQGPWAGYKESLSLLQQDEILKQQKTVLSKMEEKRQRKMNQQVEKEAKEAQLTTIFHGKQLTDYQGKSYILPSSEIRLQEHNCYIPKKQVHSFQGHTKGVNRLEFYPKYGHLLLSASMDHKIKLWDVQGTRKCLRTYMGHNQAVRDINFTNDGFHFLSAGYDQSINYWDTEYGKIIKTFHLKNYPYVTKLNPDYDKQNIFLVGSSHKKIGQYDLRTGQRTAVYDEHLGAVNSITFIDGNRKFVSTSDDKKIFVWEFGLPVVVKHISEPELNAIFKAVMHPNMKYFVGQSADNKLVIYDAKAGNFRQNRRKFFSGHVSAGYAIGMSFSPDGQFICSGDADGKLWFWDWKTTKNYRTIQGHNGVCIDVAWHPVEPSKVASCSWDGSIKLWD